ncbi:hypothetical protein [Aureimonas jatrophae]|jgi:hypothetical protein|uniref:Outer membrane lipoprotein omp10 n=1 Tax=Aureimonas jatrophae TaxID=1166073 RepID=A0A1H0IHA5_9HYPH|nr:hypothetical protein [Aureimonas jatrophae]MBB3952168.1 hypothetical protein [Aureimonas jatrophae]SDO30755.1 hypothetical protein SAMN05192530_105144 [Aureimonas jatrophae]
MRHPFFALSALAVLLTGCQSAPTARIATAPTPAGFEGNWRSVGGPVAYTATFAGGRFTSRESATGAVLAEGNYTKTGPAQTSIIYRSAARGEQTSVNCNQMAADRLACVNSAGARFELSRSA